MSPVNNIGASLYLMLILVTLLGPSMAKPFFGLNFFDPSSIANGTSLLSALAAEHAQHSLDTLQQLASLAGLAQNLSSTCETPLQVVVVSQVGVPSVSSPRSEVLAAVGQRATLDCQVHHIGDRVVSWVRSRDVQILSHAEAVFTADARVSVHVLGDRHTLVIDALRKSDSGLYECQLNTEPKRSLLFNLTVLDSVPRVIVQVSGPKRVRDCESVSFACHVRYANGDVIYPVTLPVLDPNWYKNDEIVTFQSSEGGVSLERERGEKESSAMLMFARVRSHDSGPYSCRVRTPLGPYALQTIILQVEEDFNSQVEAMQRDQSPEHHSRANHLFATNTAINFIMILYLHTLL